MTRFVTGLFLAAALAAAPVWVHAEARRTHGAAPGVRVAPAPHHHAHGSPPAHPAYAPQYHHAYASTHLRTAPPAAVNWTPRPPVFIRPAISTYATRPVYVAPRVATVPVPYYAGVDYGYERTTLARPAASGWNWAPVGSVAMLAGRGEVRYYCPDTRSYYPQVEICPSPWLKVVP